MAMPRSQFVKERTIANRPGWVSVPLSDAEKRERRLLAILILAGGVGGLGWIILKIYELASAGILFFAPIYIAAFGLIAVVPMVQLLWRFTRERQVAAPEKRALSSEEAAAELDDMSTRGELGAAGPSETLRPPPPANSPDEKPPGAQIGEWVIAMTLVDFGILFLLFPVGLFMNTLEEPAEERVWGGCVMAVFVCGSLGSALLLGADDVVAAEE
jgi:hypothetical protein